MLNFSIIPLNISHIDEICEDIAYQVKSKIATMPLFSFTLTAEGNPVIDKADIFCKTYEQFKLKLDAMGIPSGILIQASIGHGRKPNEPNAFQKCIGFTDGQQSEICCPLDSGFQEYIRKAAKRIAKSQPDHIMLDDDFRLIGRTFRGCACPLHLEKISSLTGKKLTHEQLKNIINDSNSSDHNVIKTAFIKAQIDSLIECAREIRKGIDSVNPSIPGSFCLCGIAAEGAYEIAKIMAGDKNPVIIRINNANYCSENPRDLINKSLHRAAIEISALTNKPDIILAETDTCPQNRYSTPASKLHTHFTLSILEGVGGAKHWITRMFSYEPKSGIAYRKKLEKFSGFYDELHHISKDVVWLGCKIPVPYKPYYKLTDDDASYKNCDGWCNHVLDRFGIPIHFSNSGEGTAFFDGKRDKFFTNEQLLGFLSGNIVLDADAAEAFIKRGFSKYIGVDIKRREPDAIKASGEIYNNGSASTVQYNLREIVPLSKNVKSYSNVYHLRDGKHKEIIFPAVTRFENELGGNVVVFSGNTSFPFDYTTAFGFLCEARKNQIVQFLQEFNSLPVYYTGDAEVFMKAARTKDGKLLCALVDVSLDSIENIELYFEKEVRSISRLCSDGSYEKVEFSAINNCYTLHIEAYPFDPIVLIIDN